tara:strand:- start:1594 stop:2874 length:1281 start_codon:yes stop_codon:yes gene_type:complete
MKKFTLIFYLFSFLVYSSQDELIINDAKYEKNNSYDFSLGNGVQFSFDDNKHVFGIGGMSQSRYLHVKPDGSISNPSNYFGIKRTYFNMHGKLNDGLFSFLIQTNFSESFPLLDAWAGYHPSENISLYFGQKLSPLNNLSMQIMEYDLQFASRNYLSKNFSNYGREFGFFLESKFNFGNIGIKPILAITSGDGINSFGENSLDSDQGGFKYGGRLNIYPMGFFKANNEFTGHDLLKEDDLKLMIGGSASLNIGASHKVGEGHYNEEIISDGTFMFYNSDSTLENKLPNYLKNNIDVLVKYKGFNFLLEYVNTAAYNLQGTAINPSGTLLDTTQISEYLVLGNAYNLQIGYLFKNDLSIDIRWGQSFKEFSFNENSILKNYDNMALGISKYFSKRAVKTQLMARYLNFYENTDFNQLSIEMLLQIKF